MIAGAFLILFSWIKFGGPCKVSIFFTIPGGSVTIVSYFILLFLIFSLFGGETVLLCNINKREGSTVTMLHVAAHLCLFLWYPLFFTTFSQLFALIVLVAGAVLLILELKELCGQCLLLTLSLVFKIIVSFVFTYINISFIIIN